MSFKIVVLVLLTVAFLFDIAMDTLEYRSRNNPIPSCLEGVYDEPTYKKWKSYQAELVRLDIIFAIIAFAINFTLLISNVYSIVANKVDPSLTMQVLIVVSLSLGVDTVVGFIKGYIANLKIEQKYGFNKMTLKTFIADQIKSLIISFVLLFGLILLLGVIYENLHDWVLLLFSGVLIVLVLAIMFLYPVFSKAFNKFTSLEEGSLRDKLTNLLTSHGYQVKDIKVMDASKRTTKSNAYFAGYGKLKTIVLYDTLIQNLSEEEIVAVFAHELGHGLHKDTLKNSFLSFLNIVIIVLCAWLLIRFPTLYEGFGFNNVNYAFAFIVLSSSFLPILSPLINLFTTFMSRKAEYAADAFSVKEGHGEALISALKKLSVSNFSNLAPNKVVVKLTYSHPTLEQRILAINKLLEEKQNG